MEEKKIKKKKLTLSVSSNKIHNVPHYAKDRKKTSVVVGKKTSQNWGDKRFRPKDNNINKPKSDFYKKTDNRSKTDLFSKKKISK